MAFEGYAYWCFGVKTVSVEFAEVQFLNRQFKHPQAVILWRT
jgi:hypothetical protein